MHLMQTPKQPKIILKQSPVASRPSKSKYDNPDEMMSNPRAPLAHTKLRELLCSPMAWDLLDAAEKKQVLAQFPDDQDIVDPNTESACPNVKALRNNNNFRHDVARYQDNLREGRHDPDWIAEARSAHEKRKLGLYDDYIANKFETDWEVALPGHDKVE
ncbi:Asx homology domain-containing protein [Xylariomycetidae sp. FL2044]|nr:Asx homology domain-containing protein [Xylariomycetidae sp. FL2044]